MLLTTLRIFSCIFLFTFEITNISSILLFFIIKSICILIPPFLYYLINFHLSLFFYFNSSIPLNHILLSLPFCFYSCDLCFIFLSCPQLLLSKLTSMQIKYSILKVLWNMNRSQVESFSFLFFISIPNRSRRNILEQSKYYILLCSLLSSSSLTFFFNRIYFSQLSYCLLTATLRKKIYYCS